MKMNQLLVVCGMAGALLLSAGTVAAAPAGAAAVSLPGTPIRSATARHDRPETA